MHLIFFLTFIPQICFAFQGAELIHGLPFMGLILSLSVLPLIIPHFWHHHFGKITAFWSLLCVVLLSLHLPWPNISEGIVHTCLHHYLPFIIMVGALFTITSGIHIDIRGAHGRPLENMLLLLIGSLCAGWIGTAGAAMLFIRPLLLINRHRHHRTHQIIFFLLLVCNIGGAATPLGDPPLFLGYLEGVPFIWTLRFLSLPMLFMMMMLLSIFYLLDSYLFKKEASQNTSSIVTIHITGKHNFIFIIGLITVVLSLSSFPWLRDGSLVLLALVSFFTTPNRIRESNSFNWGPLLEVAKVFISIFITLMPVVGMLTEGSRGPLKSFVSFINADSPLMALKYFWFSGLMSGVLDNAPTYLLFFHLAGGLSSPDSLLTALSLGSVFMGALTYIGNAPNFMVKSIAESHHISMPSFFGYFFMASALMIPCLFLLGWIWF